MGSAEAVIPCRGWQRASAALSAAVLLSAGCGGATPSAPTPPPVVTNTPPVIASVVTSEPRVDAGDTVQVTATITDPETPVDQLAYAWSATPVNGAFAGTGRQVAWTAPTGAPTPGLATIGLSVSESYLSQGLPQKNVVSSSVQIHYNDSPAELLGLARQFYTDFWTFSVSPAQCVRNFSDSDACAATKAEELSDITGNRENFHILGGTYPAPQVTLNGTKTFATVDGPCAFEDTVNATGAHEVVSGTCHLSAVYENWQWYLCQSTFDHPLDRTQSFRYRAP